MPLTDDDRLSAALRARARPKPDDVRPLLIVDGLCKSWPGRGAPTLDGLELELGAGDVVSITGPNGAGKTTLLRIIGGLLAPDRGSVELNGIRLGDQRGAYQRQIGLLTPGDRGLYARMTVERNLDLWARMALLTAEERSAAITYCYDRFGLADIAEFRVDRISMGQRQRVRLALAFLHTPLLLLLDEPATSLDTAALGLLRRAIDDVVARGGMCLAVAPEGADTGLIVSRHLVLGDARLEDR
ncbi:MAG TPA: ABC transporter ATP-binding protein [Thermoleophilaceae bacterium]